VSTDYAACYRDARTALTDLTRGLDDAALTRPVPATPAWSVRDVVAHVVGISVDLLHGNLAGMGSDEWTKAQVAPRRGRPFTDVLVEWGEQGPVLEDQLAGWPPEFATPLIGDLGVHDLDVRGALGRTDGRDAPAPRVAYDQYAHALGGRLDEAGLGAVALDAPDEPLVVGTGEPRTRVRASRFELLRALVGRRSATQIRAYDWDGDADHVVAVIAAYPMRGSPLDE
jgi:uncharacterized protein (TIGR03083 family)